MPTYEYACAGCGHQFEEFQSITAKPIAVCPQCKKKKVKRLVSGGAGFIFKGSGFYITDYRSEGYKAAAKSEATAGAGKTDSGTKTESSKADQAPAAAARSESKGSGKAEAPVKK